MSGSMSLDSYSRFNKFTIETLENNRKKITLTDQNEKKPTLSLNFTFDEKFNTISDIDATVRRFNVEFNLRDLFRQIINEMKFIQIQQISPKIDLQSITQEQVEAFYNACFSNGLIKKANVREALVQKLIHFDGIVYEHHKTNAKGEFAPPKFIIDVGKIPANSSVCINTGYVISIPTITKQGKPQSPFVIIPRIKIKYEKTLNNPPTDIIIPSIYVRDKDDTGFFIINFTTRAHFEGKLVVTLHAFDTENSTTEFELQNPEDDSKIAVFKTKDQKDGRQVKNLAHSIQYESICQHSSDDGKVNGVLFDTYTNTAENSSSAQQGIKVNKKQKLFVSNIAFIMSSRKREWNNSNLVSLSGLYLPAFKSINKKQLILPPVIAKNSSYSNNTHCITNLANRSSLTTSTSNFDITNFKLLNGSFANLPFYKALVKSLKTIISDFDNIKSCFKNGCKHLFENEENMQNASALIKLIDYHRNFFQCDPQLSNKLRASDEILYQTRPINKYEAISVSIYRNLCKIIAFVHVDLRKDSLHKFSIHQIESLQTGSWPPVDEQQQQEDDVNGNNKNDDVKEVDESLPSSDGNDENVNINNKRKYDKVCKDESANTNDDNIECKNKKQCVENEDECNNL